MKFAFWGFVFGLLLQSCLSDNKLENKVIFAPKEKAKKLLQTEDEFTNSWSQFDIDSRMWEKKSSKSELIDYIGTQVREWNEQEKIKLQSIILNIDSIIHANEFNLKLPPKIYFIKTSGYEEGNAQAYTRANYIVLKDNILSISNEKLKRLIIHELFHILTRSNLDFKKEMYEIIGFQVMNEVLYPENIKNLRITNPDAPRTDSFITLFHEGKKVDCTMILYANSEYTGGDFFRYLRVGFLILKGTNIKEIEYINGNPIIYSREEVKGFYEKVGRNTRYTIHPEEILAENFVYTFFPKENLPNPEIVNMISARLK